jgi:hypothetical protein
VPYLDIETVFRLSKSADDLIATLFSPAGTASTHAYAVNALYASHLSLMPRSVSDGQQVIDSNGVNENSNVWTLT